MHRDLKLQNIMSKYNDGTCIKIIDLGLSIRKKRCKQCVGTLL